MEHFSKWTSRALALLAAVVLLAGMTWSTWFVTGVAEDPADASAAITLTAKRRKTTPTPKPRTPKPTRTATPAPTPSSTSGNFSAPVTPSPVPEGPITDPQSITDWLFAHDFTLPDNFITKRQAQALGWDSSYNYLSDVAPGKSIGGDRFGNYEGLLPTAKGRQYYECDCWYVSGRRNAYRIVFSNDGLVYYTEDHYRTFTEMFPSVPGMEAAP